MTSPETIRPAPNGLVEPVNKYFHIPVAAVIVLFIKDTRVTPNQVTYASVLCGLASALAFCQGNGWNLVIAGIFLEASLILDCADGQLARAKNCATEFGRLLDGIGGYVAYLSMIGGMMIGLEGQFYALAAITVFTVLRAITFDYYKLSIGAMIDEGIDASQRDVHAAYQNFRATPSALMKSYFYYLQFQRLLFHGQWTSLQKYSRKKPDASETRLTGEQRRRYYQKTKTLRAVWSWNGHEIILFLIAVLSVLGIIEISLTALAFLAGIQFCLTFIFHHYFIRHEVRP